MRPAPIPHEPRPVDADDARARGISALAVLVGEHLLRLMRQPPPRAIEPRPSRRPRRPRQPRCAA
jgi:hypothetical protein